MPARNYYRGAYGDTKPVTTHPSKALDHKGKIRPDHFTTEAAAWGSILAYCEDSAKHAERRYAEANRAMDGLAHQVVKCRAARSRVGQAYRIWKARHQLSAAV